MERKVFWLVAGLVAVAIVLGLIWWLAGPHGSLQTNPQAALHIGTRSKTSDCVAQAGLPDTACTPGATLANVTRDQICAPGYAHSVRNVPSSEKAQVYVEYGITSHRAGEYEVDHLVSLELGGSNDIANLWPEAAQPVPGFHEKDRVENYLHEQVCSGAMSLNDAQAQIANNWLNVYQHSIVGEPQAGATAGLP